MRSTCWRYFAKYVGVFKPFLFPPRTLWENNPGTQPRSPNWWDKFLIQPAFGVVLHKTSIVFHHEALCCVSWVRALPHPVVNCWWSSEIEQLAGVSSWDLVARVNTGHVHTCSRDRCHAVRCFSLPRSQQWDDVLRLSAGAKTPAALDPFAAEASQCNHGANILQLSYPCCPSSPSCP